MAVQSVLLEDNYDFYKTALQNIPDDHNVKKVVFVLNSYSSKINEVN
jgi:hypothetical protein